MNPIIIILLASCTILHFNIPSTRADSNEEEGTEEDGGDYKKAYMDALVKSLELLYSIKATFRTIADEFKRIHEKLGVDTMEPKELLDESLLMIERNIEIAQNKFQADGVTIDRMERVLKPEVYDTLTKNMESLKQIAELMENQFIHEMVETIKDQAKQGESDVFKFQDEIEDLMQNVDAAAVTAEMTTRRQARVYGTTTTPWY